MEIDKAWFSLDECIDTIAKNEIKQERKKLMEKKIVVQGESVATPVKVKVLTK